MKRPIIATALALTLTIGATSAAYAWGGGFGHHENPSHRVMEHGSAAAPAPQANQALAYNQHGGGHEQAQNNNALHQAEPQHQDVNPNTPAPSFEQHGGDHEEAANNKTIHEQEMQDPNHKDI